MSSFDRNVSGAQAKPAAPRYRTLDQTLFVMSRTLGAPVEYELRSANISKSGILLENSRGKRAPFNVNTLLEMTIDPEANWLQRPIQCVGKVVRLANSEAGSTQYGVKIVQIDGVESTVWEECFKELAKNASHLLMTGKPGDALKALPHGAN
jgi:hypothetical protein